MFYRIRYLNNQQSNVLNFCCEKKKNIKIVSDDNLPLEKTLKSYQPVIFIKYVLINKQYNNNKKLQ